MFVCSVTLLNRVVVINSFDVIFVGFVSKFCDIDDDVCCFGSRLVIGVVCLV